MKRTALCSALLLLACHAPATAKTVYLTCTASADSSGGMYQEGFVIDTSEKSVFMAWRRYGADHPRPHAWLGKNMSVESFTSQQIHFYSPPKRLGSTTLPRFDYVLDRSKLTVDGGSEIKSCQLVDKPFMDATPKF